MTILDIKDLTIMFGGLKAVSKFDLTLTQGELAGMIGPNGAGKTTVFNMLTGVYTPTSGDIVLNTAKAGEKDHNVRINAMAPHQIAKLGIARTFQNIRLFKDLTVLDNVRIACHFRAQYNAVQGILRTNAFIREEQKMVEKALELLKIFNMQGKINELAKNLPYGEQRKLEIVRALATDPKLLLLDEPAAGMNPQETQNLMNLIHFIRDNFKLTILLIEHDMKLVMGICERITVLDYGSVIAVGTPAQISRDPKVIKAYLGEEAVIGA